MGIRFLALTVCLIVTFVPGALSVKDYFELIGFPVTLECDVAGVNDTVVWKKNGKEVSYNGTINLVSSSLVFESVQLSDGGIYQCSVNKGNNITQGDNITLHVIDKLNPPLNLTVSDIRSDQVTISWTSGNHQDLVNQYNIEQKSGSGNESEWTDTSPPCITKNVADNSSSFIQCETSNCSSVVVKDLLPDTDYMFRVQAVPKSGEGSDFSQETRLITTLSRGNYTTPVTTTAPLPTTQVVTTAPRLLLRAPLDFRAKDVTDSRMTLKWKAPNSTDLPAIDGYRLYVVPSANPNITLRREPTRYNLTNLDAAKNYSLTLVALYGEHGEGEAISLNQSTDSKVPQGLEPKETSAPTTVLSFTFTSLTSKKMLGATQISDIVANDDALVTTAAIIGTLLAIGIVVLGAVVFVRYRKTRQVRTVRHNYHHARLETSTV